MRTGKPIICTVIALLLMSNGPTSVWADEAAPAAGTTQPAAKLNVKSIKMISSSEALVVFDQSVMGDQKVHFYPLGTGAIEGDPLSPVHITDSKAKVQTIVYDVSRVRPGKYRVATGDDSAGPCCNLQYCVNVDSLQSPETGMSKVLEGMIQARVLVQYGDWQTCKEMQFTRCGETSCYLPVGDSSIKILGGCAGPDTLNCLAIGSQLIWVETSFSKSRRASWSNAFKVVMGGVLASQVVALFVKNESAKANYVAAGVIIGAATSLVSADYPPRSLGKIEPNPQSAFDPQQCLGLSKTLCIGPENKTYIMHYNVSIAINDI